MSGAWGRTPPVQARHRRITRRRAIATLASALMLSSTIAASLVLSDPAAPPADARFATDGAGTYKGSIDWFEWGSAGAAIPAAGTTKTNTRTIAGQELATTCTMGTVTGGALQAYRSGSFSGDGLDDMYNISGTGASNTLVAGLANTTGGATIDFAFSCSATLNSVPVPLAGLVMADAEASSTSNNEYVEATIPAGADWRLIDRFRAPATCTQSTPATRTGQTLRLGGTAGCTTAYPTTVAFMDGATSADVQIHGGGVSAIALGVVLFSDFGDAPASYGEAGSLYSPPFTGGVVAEGSSSVFAATLATLGQPVTRLGASVDSEANAQFSADATADGADEDAIATPAPIVTEPGSTYSLPNVACTGPGEVSGWIDWDGNGSYQSDERSNDPSCTGASVALSWTVPADARTSSTFMRLRIGPDAGPAAGPTGVTTAGEVEDYALNLTVPSDSGDAPNSYGTLTAGGGARHDVTSYNAGANTAPLMLGTKVDVEFDGVPSAGASGDDTAGIDDEDALASAPVFSAGSTTASVSATVTNSSGTGATLYGWVDADLDGAFEASEFASAPVAAGATTAALSWSGLSSLQVGTSPLVRLRLTSAILTDNTGTAAVDERSRGAATDGEVEDYLASVEPPAVDCSTDSAVFNTAFNGSGGKLPAGSRDRFWEVGTGNATGPASVSSYMPAFVIPPVAGAWDASPFGNADWISYNTNGSHAARIETYFRYRFRVDAAVPLDGFALQMDFLADNSVPEVWINGTPQSPTQDGLPQTTGDAYQYVGFKLVNRARTVLSDGFQHGANEIVVRVASDPGFVGFMAQMQQSPLCNDWGDAPNTYGTDAASGGASHGVSNAAAAPLRLGDAVDVEPEGLPGTAADGDDTTDTDDEAAVADPITVNAGLPTAVTVSVTNDTAQVATLAGWIDLDDDGIFEGGERVTRSIPASSGTAGYGLTFPATTVVGDSYARFRVFPGNVADPLPTGSTSAGEVEDYPTTFDPGDPIFFGCSDKVTFDTSNENWRAATTRGGTTVQLQPQPVEWQPDAGNPGGAVIEDDLDGQWTELWTPELNANGFTTDYSFAIGQTLAFDYRNNTGISVKLYMGIVGANGKFYWYDFSNQITESKAWNRIRIPMDASKWHVSFNSSGPTGAAPTATAFADALKNIVRFSFSIEGQSGPDRTAFDNFGQLCSDFGDAPNSYGTEIGGESPSHAVDDTLPALRLGASIDVETAGQPGTGAILDDAIGIDDEDGLPDQIVMTTGDPTSVDVVVTNQTSERATLAGWLDLDGDGTFEVGERLTAQVPAGTNAATFTLDFPAGTTTTDTYARFRIFPGNVTAPLPKGSASAGEIEDYPVTVENRALEVTKSSDATVNTRPGDTVHYTVELTNTGDAPFTVGNPAVMVDDLSAVLDDGDYNDDASAAIGALAVADPTYAEPRLRWAGPLPGGATVTITYSVKLTGGGDGVVRNVAWAPEPGDPDPPTPDCDDPATTVPCAEEEFELPRLTLRKSSNRTDLPMVGEHLTYTVVVKNEGPGDYTAAAPATFIDDLTDVLDDANFDAGSITADVGDATFTDPNLSWSGVLAAGDSATITYSVTYTAKAGGDQQLDNAACVPEDEALDPTRACTTVRVPGSGLEQSKVSDPPTGTVVQVGDEITYTLRFSNTGPASAIVSTNDDLSDVLDDAELVGNPSSPDGLTVTPAGDTLVITGIVPTGETYTVSYTVRVLPIADQGNNRLRNTLACQPGDPLTCEPETTDHKVRAIKVTKTSDADPDPRQGDTVTYTVTAENVGAGDYTLADPATVVDDLTGVIDDGDYNEDATAEISGTPVADPSYVEPRVTWTGALASGETVTITYTVELDAGGDGVVRNVVWSPDPGDPVGPTPDCADPATVVPCAEEEYELPRLTIAKTSDHVDLPAVGEHLTYTVIVKNEGPGDYTAGSPAEFTDDLTDVLDDATFDAGSITADVGDATFTSPNLSWTGVLAAGEDAEITYSVTYTAKAGGDQQLDNNACVPEDDALDALEACDVVRVPGADLTQTKTSSPADGEPVDIGDEITYTLSFINDGQTSAIVSTSDDLFDVLDDAELVGVPSSPDGLTVTLAGDSLVITGIVPAGQTYTVSYTVRVTGAGAGDGVLRNSLACQPGEPPACEPETTEHPVRKLKVTKTSNATADTRQGDTVAYTITAENTGEGDYTTAEPAQVVDDLTGVLDDAVYNDDASASVSDDPTYTAPQLHWEGPLGPGDIVTIRYTVTLKGGGDGVVRNVAWAPNPGDPPGPEPDCDSAATVVPCAEEDFDLPRLSIRKAADRTDLPAVGETVTYTVVVKNEGPGDYTATAPATFTDDLTEVLDDATFVDGSITSPTGSATFTDPNLIWSGVLAAGGDATVTYRVRYTGAGDHELDNNACVPEEQALVAAKACITVRVPGSSLEQRKSSNPASGTSVDAGDQITYTLTFINTGPAAATVDTTDDLSGVLDDADLTDGPTADAGLTATQNGNQIEIDGSVPSGQTRTVTYKVTVKEYDAQGDHRLRNALACQPGEPAGCAPETTEHKVRSVELTKTSNATADSRPGDVITYTVTARNRGTGDYTALEPAVVVDDLAGVLDDAVFNDDASASIGGAAVADPALLAPRMAWSGPLGAGETVTITYTVTLKGGGDGHVDNVAWAPDPGDPHGPTPDCDDPAVTVPCGDESYLLPKLSITKSADPAVVNAVGDIVTYTVIVKNDGPGDYSAAEPATFADDLSAVLDDATFVAGSITATRGDASFATPELSWTGVLTAGQSSTVTYQVRYTGGGNRSLVNAACVPEAEATDPTEDCATVTVPGAGLSQTKTADPASGTTVGAGDRIAYTLTFTNTGTGPARVDTSDDLSGVLDDAVLVAGPTAETGLTATRNGDRILITGDVPPGQTRTVTYTVEVEAFADQADHVLRNALACQPGEPADCDPERTEHPIGHLTVTKTSDAVAGIDTGDTVTYKVTVLNDGATDFTEADPAVVVDDLSDVLDDATWGGASSDRGTTSFADPTLTWSGALPSGQKATITYTVTVTNNGDHDLGNIASVPGCDEPGCNPPPVITDLPYVVPDKVSDPPSGESVQAGDIVTYTLSWTNEGKAPGVVDATDDLSDILDDAELVGEPVSSSARVTVTRVGDTLRIVGPIDPDETVSVTYRVRIKPDGERGDNVAGNVLTPDTPQVDCNEDDECEPVDPPVTENPIGDLDDSKSVDPSSGDPVAAGDKLTYTLTFHNKGTGSVDVDRVDDLSGVLDDAKLVSGPTSSNPALQVSGPDGDGRIRVTGTLEPGQTVTVTYTVRVKKKTDRGDGQLANFLVDPGEDPPPHCNVARAARAVEPGDCTENPASEVEATKDVDVPHGSSVIAGDVLTYTLKFVNRGNGAGEVDYIDNVADVLDDASWVSGPTSSDPALRARRDNNRLLITGTLEPGQVVTITYQVRVKADGQRGNGQLLNYLFPEGGVSPTACQSDRDDCTENAVSPNAAPPPPGTDPGDLPDTGSQFGPGLLVAGLLSVLLGVGLVVASRRRGPGEVQ